MSNDVVTDPNREHVPPSATDADPALAQEPASRARVVVAANTPMGELPEMLQLERLYTGVERHSRFAGLRKTPAEDLVPEGMHALRSMKGTDVSVVLAEGPDHLVLIQETGDSTMVRVTANDPAVAERVLADITDRVPAREDGVEITFWHYVEGQGPHRAQRFLELPRWSEVQNNYPATVAAPLAELIRMRPEAGGRLILWHGAPGTGKTSALRALIRDWSPWCDAHFVSDPEQFFGRADYLLHALTSDDHGAARRWRLVIAEDADDYIRSDARRRSGWAMTRLLNLTDGLLGQGLRVLVLITTNEDLGRLHPAVLRAGRCLASVEFGPFSSIEAEAWLGADNVDRPMTLAELYERRNRTVRIGVEATAQPVSTGSYL